MCKEGRDLEFGVPAGRWRSIAWRLLSARHNLDALDHNTAAVSA